MNIKSIHRDLLQYGLTPNKLLSRLLATGSTPILANSMPKAGTNLLLRVLYLMPPLHRKLMHTLLNADPSELYGKLESIRPGQIAAAHLYHTPQLAHTLLDLNIKHIFMIRDPRDIVVSNFIYITYKDTRHRLHHYFSETLHSDEERLSASIAGIKANLLRDNVESRSIAQHIEQYLPWMNDDWNYIVRFEELIGGRGGGHEDKQLEVLTGICNYIDLELSEQELNRVANQAFFTSSRTFFKGNIGSWKEHFTDRHRNMFKSLAGEMLIKLGYESNMDW